MKIEEQIKRQDADISTLSKDLYPYYTTKGQKQSHMYNLVSTTIINKNLRIVLRLNTQLWSQYDVLTLLQC